MSSKLYIQLVSIAAIFVAAFFLINPMGVIMPHNVHMLMLDSVIVIAASFAVLVIAEGKGGDEREGIHKAIAGRIAFFVGAWVMILGITVQTYSGSTDPWLVGALCAMLAGKVIARVAAAYKQ